MLCPTLFCPVPASEVHKEFRSESSGQVQISPSALPVFSAMPLDLSTTNFYFSTLPALQSECPSVQSMLSSPSLSIVSVPFQRSSIYCDVSSGTPWPLVPVSLRHHLFMALHGISHPGVRASRRLLSSRFVWPCLAKDVSLWTRSCLRCQQSKVQSHVKSSVPSIQVPGRQFSHVHLDLVGPLPSSQGYSYLLTMIDRTSRWPEAVPLSSISTKSCARAFISTWISRYGVPAMLTSDR